MFAYFQGKLKIFQSYAQYRREKGGMTNKTYRSSATKARPPRGKKAIRKRVSADAFSRRAFLSLRVLLFRPFENGGFALPFERLRFGLFVGVSLSAAARSAAALVYDKLTLMRVSLEKNIYLCYDILKC